MLCWKGRRGLLGKGAVLEREKGTAREKCCVGVQFGSAALECRHKLWIKYNGPQLLEHISYLDSL